MSTLLQINSSIFSTGGQSSQLAEQFVAAWRKKHPDTNVIVRDLASDPVPHLTADRFHALLQKPIDRTPAAQAVVNYSDALVDELKRADTIVLGLPLYNFGVPSALKAYFDHVARAGVTFSYSEKGPVGLLTGKKAYVFATRGGLYAGTPLDTQTQYVRNFLRFLGIADVEFVYAEGLAISEQAKQAAVTQARRAVERLVAAQVVSVAA
jgi:FMN-dependent NADH-azoreductase